MDLVLGLSLTTAALRWVLVEGTTGEGDPVDRGELDIPAIDDVDADLLIRAVLNPDVIPEHRIRVVGVTSTADAEPAVGAVVAALAARGHHGVAHVSDSAAVAALAGGIADLTEYDDVAVCIVEPDSAFVAVVDGGAVTVEHIDRPADRADTIELTSSVIVALDRELEAIFVIGSDDVAVIVAAIEAITVAAVFSAAEADLALARGAALVAARTLDMSGPRLGGLSLRPVSRAGLLVGVLAVGVVTFVVSLSLAIGLNLTRSDPVETAQTISAAGESERVAAPPPPARPVVGLAEMANAVAKTMTVALPPAPAPEYVPPPVAAPPPAYVPPAPVYVPPPVQQPRLRDRIIDRIPIIGRFHDPGR
ncbi:hypothetical protein H7J06_05275 [Mycobacterium hodleri]|uniref:DUF7159 family protein n=1 Tax=Mycolicibacterium hodleri TaxID=49897 RepID=UPI0021F32047|nr:hypothetical protein [Mycolicibacterium hodleri]MCV7132390.1 hypothetical protein [Mycolicibacterium hodleri]